MSCRNRRSLRDATPHQSVSRRAGARRRELRLRPGGATSPKAPAQGSDGEAHGGDPAPFYGAASGQNSPSRTQSRPRKWAWIVLDFFVRFGAFQWVTSSPKQKTPETPEEADDPHLPLGSFSARHRRASSDWSRRTAGGETASAAADIRVTPAHWRHVESRKGAVAWPVGRRPVSLPRSSNRTCPIKASGFPTDFIARLTAAVQLARVVDAVRRGPR